MSNRQATGDTAVQKTMMAIVVWLKWILSYKSLCITTQSLWMRKSTLEGFTFNQDFNQMIMVAEPRAHQTYSADMEVVDLIFADGFELNIK